MVAEILGGVLLGASLGRKRKVSHDKTRFAVIQETKGLGSKNMINVLFISNSEKEAINYEENIVTAYAVLGGNGVEQRQGETKYLTEGKDPECFVVTFDSGVSVYIGLIKF